MRGMFRLLLKSASVLAAVAVLGALFIASPLRAAWALREAVTGSDVTYLEAKVHWPAVRETMRQSMLRVAIDAPLAEPGQPVAPTPPPTSAWARLKHRVKTYAGRRVVNKMVEDYINAEGFPKLYRARRAAHTVTSWSRQQENSTAYARFREVWSRIRRAEFVSLTSFAIEIEDEFDAGRKYAAIFELKRSEWILTALHIRDINETTPVADAR